MNRATAYAEPVACGFIGRFKLDWRAETFTVRERRAGPVVYFDTAAEAEVAAWRIKDKVERPYMRRDGAKIEANRAADAHFNLPVSRSKLVRQSKTKRLVEVVRA